MCYVDLLALRSCGHVRPRICAVFVLDKHYIDSTTSKAARGENGDYLLCGMSKRVRRYLSSEYKLWQWVSDRFG